jgi:hypothetical protein
MMQPDEMMPEAIIAAPRFDQVIPVVRIFSVAKAREFYVDFLGFALDWEHRFDASAPAYL